MNVSVSVVCQELACRFYLHSNESNVVFLMIICAINQYVTCADWPVSVASEALETASGDLSSVGLTELKVPSPPSRSGGAGSIVAVDIGVLNELRMDGCSTTMPLCSWTGRQQQGLPCHCSKWYLWLKCGQCDVMGKNWFHKKMYSYYPTLWHWKLWVD